MTTDAGKSSGEQTTTAKFAAKILEKLLGECGNTDRHHVYALRVQLADIGHRAVEAISEQTGVNAFGNKLR